MAAQSGGRPPAQGGRRRLHIVSASGDAQQRAGMSTAAVSAPRPPLPPLAAVAHGLGWLVTHPGVWPGLIVGWIVAALLLAGVAIGSAWLAWPDGAVDWHWLWRVPLAVAAGLGALAAAWALLLPPLLSLLCEALVRRVLHVYGCHAPGETLLGGLHSTLHVMLATLPLRLLAILLALLSWLLGPFGIPLAAYAVARIAVLDACDLVLAVEGQRGPQRIAWLRAHGGVQHRLALGAIPLHFLLGFSVLGWPLWLPSLVTGMACWRARSANAVDPE
jgi:hypothetical protein